MSKIICTQCMIPTRPEDIDLGEVWVRDGGVVWLSYGICKKCEADRLADFLDGQESAREAYRRTY